MRSFRPLPIGKGVVQEARSDDQLCGFRPLPIGKGVVLAG